MSFILNILYFVADCTKHETREQIKKEQNREILKHQYLV